METYHKIQTLFKRHLDGPKKGKMIKGEWTTPELEYLAGNEWEFTEKVDGTNIRICIKRIEDSLYVEFGGRSDNASIPAPLMNWLKDMFPNSHPSRRSGNGRDAIVGLWMLDNNLDEVILFGEGYGPKIQNGDKYREDPAFVLFDVKIGDWWLARDDVDDIASKLGIESVPVIGTGTLLDAIDIVSSGLTWDKHGKMTNWGGVDSANKRRFSGLKSRWGNFEAEGIVARPVVPMFDRKGQRIICKIKAVDFR